MRSIFDGTNEIILETLGLASKNSLKHKSICNDLKPLPDYTPGLETLVPRLFSRIEENWNGRLPSKANWKLRRQTTLNPINSSPEVLLERAIVILASRGFLQGWFNQMPIASGLLDGNSGKRAAIDLIRFEGHSADLVELKWESDTPLYAIFEILRYGLVFLFFHQNRKAFDCDSKPLMQVEKLSLRVLAPSKYYSGCDLDWLRGALEKGMKRLFMEKTNNAIQFAFSIQSFPFSFELPFKTGEEVIAFETLPKDAPQIAYLINAMSDLKPVWNKGRV